MAPIPRQHIDANTPLHRLSRRDAEGGRVAGWLVGCLLAAVLACAIIYYCFNCHFSPKKKTKKGDTEHHHKPHKHPMMHHAHPTTRGHTHGHTAFAHRDEIPHTHRWTHHHHRRAHHHHQKRPKKKTKTKKKAKSKKRASKNGRGKSRGVEVRFMPMPPMEMPMGVGMPIAPAPVAGMGMGMGLGGVGIGVGMGVMGDDFVDYGPPPGDMDPGTEIGWGVDPMFPLQRFMDDNYSDADEDMEVGCNECCFSFFDALCGVEPGSRDLRREAAGEGPIPLDDNEMAAD
ncbi:hypothetical protein CGLO_01016 [Colletotrichum gloeosporioides Cg-14]|uniref:Uncharacterized protein n=1 Tax=Colletotrichum gloeosporioides (strain Cg-14) TaxID=1237896 RepID=T0L1C3_COLGC|nr:hypothetical protein CGLO_01016 [Colletotrichum gloeosporioides Cg-14]